MTRNIADVPFEDLVRTAMQVDRNALVGKPTKGDMRDNETAPRNHGVRLRWSPRVDQPAAPVVTFPGIPGITHDAVSDTTRKLAAALAGRKVTALTERWTDFRKVTATRFTLTLRGIGGSVEVCKRNPTKTSDFKGWVAYYTLGGERIELTRVAKGDSIETNGERADCARHALTVLQLRLTANS